MQPYSVKIIITWVSLHHVPQFLNTRTDPGLSENSHSCMCCTAQIPHGVQHTLGQRLACSLLHYHQRDTKHILAIKLP